MISVPAGGYVLGIGDKQVAELAERSVEAEKWRAKGFFVREQPQHECRLAAYAIAEHPITVAQYRSFVDDGGYRQRVCWTEAGWRWLEQTDRSRPDYWDDRRWTADDQLPVVGVSWFEAVAYCGWLAAKSGRPYRLPTEAEWEAAARGGDDRLYPWGATFDVRRCNCRESGLGRTVTIGCFSPAGDSPFGVAEMVGNVSEWTMSLFRPYPILPDDGRNALQVPGERVTRGGSRSSPAISARTTARGMNDPEFTDDDLGFRLAVSI